MAWPLHERFVLVLTGVSLLFTDVSDGFHITDQNGSSAVFFYSIQTELHWPVIQFCFLTPYLRRALEKELKF